MKRHAQDPKWCTLSKSTAEQTTAVRDGMRKAQRSVAPVSWQLLGKPAEWEFLNADWVSGARRALGCLIQRCLSWHLFIDHSPPWWPWKCHSITVCLSFSCCKEVSPFLCTALLMKDIALELIADYTLQHAAQLPHTEVCFHQWSLCQPKCAYQDIIPFIKLIQLRQAES